MEKLDLILQQITELKNDNYSQHQALIKRADLTNGRINKLEAWRDRMLGAWAVLAFVGGVFVAYILQVV